MWQDVFKNPLVAAGIGGAVGATAGTLITARVLRVKYEKIANEEIESVKARFKAGPEYDLVEMARRYENLEISEDFDVNRNHYEQYQETVHEEGYAQTEVSTDESSVQRESIRESADQSHNIFGGELVEFDMTLENLRRMNQPKEPYIITKAEFEADELGWEQDTLTFYEGDNTPADGRDEAIPNFDHVIGDANLLRFGYGSEDRNIVYIRNPRIQAEWEIVHSDGKFSVDVLGFDDTDAIQHSDRRRRRIVD